MKEFEVSEISFNASELTEVKLDSLKQGTLCKAHLFTFVREKPFLLLQAGDFIQIDFLKKYQDKRVSTFSGLVLIDENNMALYRKLFTSLKQAGSQYERYLYRDKILTHFLSDHWNKSDKSLLDYVLITYELFKTIPTDDIESLYETSSSLYSRSLLVASLSVISALLESVTDYEWLKDIYNAALLMDFGLIESDEPDYHLLQAAYLEQQGPQLGEKYLKEAKGRDTQLEKFYGHPKASKDYSHILEEYFTYPEVLNWILYHHENTQGNGFPGKIACYKLGKLPLILNSVDKLIPIKEFKYRRNDGQKLLTTQLKLLENGPYKSHWPCQRLYSLWLSCCDELIGGLVEK